MSVASAGIVVGTVAGDGTSVRCRGARGNLPGLRSGLPIRGAAVVLVLPVFLVLQVVARCGEAPPAAKGRSRPNWFMKTRWGVAVGRARPIIFILAQRPYADERTSTGMPRRKELVAMQVPRVFSIRLSALEPSSVSQQTSIVAAVARVGSPSSWTVTDTAILPSAMPPACAT